MRILQEQDVAGAPRSRPIRKKIIHAGSSDPDWYKTAVIYELHVRSFADSNADGIGDLPGLIDKLDYLQELGVTALWLLPFYPSPLKDDGYDIADYYTINPSYGTLKDFERFMKEAHARGLRVITELVLNHTSDQNSWFQRSRRAAPGSVHRDFYVWSDHPEKYREVRIIFKDFEPSNWSWDPVAKAYYWHRFYAHQPDLNFDNPAVHDEVLKVIDFWLDKGVDGFRLDAVPYLYEREGTSSESLPETHAFLKKIRAHIDTKYGDRVLLAEANQWPEDAVSYYGQGKGDECHMAFHFPVMPRLFMAVRMEDRVPLVDILEQTPALPETGQWALFLRNHDELTLEMVTDEERDFMYKSYAQELKARINLGIRRRLAPLLGNDRRKVELLNLLLLSLPGTPVIYYGDEIGMGDNIFLGDRNGVRTPMQWSSDKNAGFSRAHPNALFLPIVLDPEYHYETINVETQHRSASSLLWWMRRTLMLRNRCKAFGLGTMVFLHPDNRCVLAYIRSYENENVLVVANLSRFAQPVELDLSAFRGFRPVEMFGNSPFPPITNHSYRLSLTGHSAYWFILEPTRAAVAAPTAHKREPARLSGAVEELFSAPLRRQLERAILDYWRSSPPSAVQAKSFSGIRLRDAIETPSHNSDRVFLLVLTVEHPQRENETHALLVAIRSSSKRGIEAVPSHRVIAHLFHEAAEHPSIIFDLNADPAGALVSAMGQGADFIGSSGRLAVSLDASVKKVPPMRGAIRELSQIPLTSSAFTNEKQAVRFSERLDADSRLDAQFAKALTARFEHVAPLLASVDYQHTNGAEWNIAMLFGWSGEHRTAQEYTNAALSRFLDRARSLKPVPAMQEFNLDAIITTASKPKEAVFAPVMGLFPTWLRLLGQRVGEMHAALGAEQSIRELAAEEFTPFYQRSLYQSIRNHLLNSFDLLKKATQGLQENGRGATELIAMQPAILRRLKGLFEKPMAGFRLRAHGELELRNIIHTGKDFLIIPAPLVTHRSASDRAIKRTPLRDVAFVLRSLQESAMRAGRVERAGGGAQSRQNKEIARWLAYWHYWSAVAFLDGYLPAVAPAKLLPREEPQLALLLHAHMIDRALSQLVRALEVDTPRVPLVIAQLQALCR